MKKAISISLFFFSFSMICMKGAEYTPVNFEKIFIDGIRTRNQDTILGVLISDDKGAIQFRENNSLAKKLSNILYGSAGEDFIDEIKRGYSFKDIFYMAKEMAIIGGNQKFLDNLPKN